MKITLPPFFAKLILRIIPYRLSHRVLVMCKGYNENYKNFTELVWDDDKYLDFYDKETYPKFQLWIQPRTKGAGHGSTSRAFYARIPFVSQILKLKD